MSPWKEINLASQLDLIVEKSFSRPQVIFKHSTSCFISKMAKKSLESDWSKIPENLDMHYLDLLSHRDISNLIQDELKVHHESPQIILINKGEVTYDESHGSIKVSELVENLNTLPPLAQV